MGQAARQRTLRDHSLTGAAQRLNTLLQTVVEAATMTESLIRALDLRAANGTPAKLWLRDDDAIAPTRSA